MKGKWCVSNGEHHVQAIITGNQSLSKTDIDAVRARLEKLVPSHAPGGCIQYDLHQVNETRTTLHVLRNWEKPRIVAARRTWLTIT
jgi:quinol monooxygenase YgiN